MSVRFHEAVSFDSTKYRLDWRDDFWGDSLDARWAVTGTGSAAVVDAQDGGVVRLTTGATTGNSYLLYWGNYRSLHVDKKVTMEARVRLNSVADIIAYPIGLFFDGNNGIYIRVADTASTIRCINGGAGTTLNSGLTHDTAFHIYKIECFPTGEVHYYYDGTETSNSPITTNIPSDAADYLQPYLYIYTGVDAAKSMDVDYVYVRQNR